jgi:hypothetical protein
MNFWVATPILCVGGCGLLDSPPSGAGVQRLDFPVDRGGHDDRDLPRAVRYSRPGELVSLAPTRHGQTYHTPFELALGGSFPITTAQERISRWVTSPLVT